MCLAVPAQIVKFLENDLVIADFGRGVKREVSTALLPIKLELNDWILIHTGYAVSKVEPKEAEEILALWEEIWASQDESAGVSQLAFIQQTRGIGSPTGLSIILCPPIFVFKKTVPALSLRAEPIILASFPSGDW